MSALSEQSLRELQSVVLTQHHMLGRLRNEVDEAWAAGPSQDRFSDLDKLIAEVEADASYLTPQDVADLPAPVFVATRRQSVAADLARLQFDSWENYVLRARTYAAERDVDVLGPYEALLTDADWEQLKHESYGAQYRWDKWDCIVVGVAGALGALTDLLFVKTPDASELTNKIKGFHFGPETQKWLEETFVVSFDKGGKGWGGGDHRFQSLGHDPVLGFLFGIFDLISGSRTGFRFDTLTKTFSFVSDSTGDVGVGLIEAMIRQVGHLISDLATHKGLPAPFMPLLQLLNFGEVGKKERTIAQLARWMYDQGYDLRHFLVGAITPAVIELVVRTYVFIRHWCEHGEAKLLIGGNPKYRSMLFWAHSIAAAVNAGKVAFTKNIVAINWAEWLAFMRYLGPYVKYWLFDRQRLKMEHMERIATDRWREFEANSAMLLERVAAWELQPITLGLPGGAT